MSIRLYSTRDDGGPAQILAADRATLPGGPGDFAAPPRNDKDRSDGTAQISSLCANRANPMEGASHA